TPTEHVPKKLAETMLASDGFVPYEVNSPLWSDGAVKHRFIKVPEGQRVTVAEDGGLALPVGTVFMKTFDLPPRHVETRAMIVGNTETYGVTYRWNPEGTEA